MRPLSGPGLQCSHRGPRSGKVTNESAVALRTTRSRARADEWALVLTAEGLTPRVRAEGGVFVLLLPAHQVDGALDALATYEDENPPAVERGSSCFATLSCCNAASSSPTYRCFSASQ